ncbi:MAG: carbohydrate ABC transporter permease [Sphaerochaeta sp.]|jgi:multiple sugar transport system permease protein|uniref:carbohydrate ABC transporter permease n=1 Tax=unclassified Sphaerochaeta TaxID=2637943 RepID=UPI000A6E9947|nr:carbohydrate ABC transporter permease [Sphaerochaeta sp.]MCK9600159.1 carbohydrate ABC transporter permease [Sphaerochaeta sp.]MDX9825793.1 carbohydrate ABC transporter permease [Sphaerochaeta sp.]
MLKRKPLYSTLLYLAVICLVVYLIAPFLWLIIMSFSSANDLTQKPLRWIPSKLDFSSYKDLLTMGINSRGELFVNALRNSLTTAFIAVFVSLLVTIPASWVLSRYPGKKSWVLTAAIFTFMLPPVAYALPLYRMLTRMGWLDNSVSLALVYCTIVLPFCVWLIKANIDSIPYELEESAIIDGAGITKRILLVVMPLLLPALGTVSLLALIMAWDEYFYALLFTSSKEAITLPVVIANLASGRQSNYNLIAAGGVIASTPPVLIGVLFQRALIRGLVQGGVKE